MLRHCSRQLWIAKPKGSSQQRRGQKITPASCLTSNYVETLCVDFPSGKGTFYHLEVTLIVPIRDNHLVVMRSI